MIESLELTIWERALTLPVQYDCYEGEDITKEQIEALKHFSSHSEWISTSKDYVETFCKGSVMEDTENSKDNIFSYIKPESIFVKRDKEHPRVALMCNYRYDIEHGLAIVFSSDGEITIGSQDIIL